MLSAAALGCLLRVGSSGCRRDSETAIDRGGNKNAGTSVSSADNPTITTSGLAPVPPAVMNAEFKTLDGKTVKLADYAGKVVVLDVWATWCPPCREEIPHLIELNDQYKAQGLEIIGLTTEDPATDEEKVREFADQFKIDYQLGWAPRELALGVLRMSGRDSIPQTVVITRDGRVIKHFVGFHPVRTPDSMKNIIEQAIKL
jgi:thiol-disulfide isomerase/thioredoxin